MRDVKTPNSGCPFDLDDVRVGGDSELLLHLVHAQFLLLRAHSRLIGFVLLAREVVSLVFKILVIL